jgi:aspartokinase/homoserine dehydrogenase 1
MPTSETAINKAFEVEILQNKIKPCIVENLCIIALVGENMKIIKG